jgi:hypothetical protein
MIFFMKTKWVDATSSIGAARGSGATMCPPDLNQNVRFLQPAWLEQLKYSPSIGHPGSLPWSVCSEDSRTG